VPDCLSGDWGNQGCPAPKRGAKSSGETSMGNKFKIYIKGE